MRVRAVDNCAIGTNYYKQGDEFEYDGPPNPHLEPLEKPKQEPKQEKHDEASDYPGKKK